MAEIFDKMKMEFVDKDESVQVIADNIRDTGEVPEKYVRSEIKADPVIVDVEGYNLPVIDMSRLLNPEFSEEETAKLGSACEHWGFFQLVNHGLDGGFLQQIKADITEFFSLPLEEKLAVAIPPNGIQGFGHHFVFSKEQKLDWVDMLFLATRPVEERSLAFWPTKPSTFRDTLDKYSLELANVSAQLFKFMANNLRVNQEALLGTFKGLPQSMRINYYPPCSQANKVLGLSPHTDGVGMTFLLQVNDVEGLQIRKDDKWFSVEAIPEALVVNIGDVLEILTNGKYKSIEHRAVINPVKERITIATFLSVNLGCMIGPLQGLLKEGEARYKVLDSVEFTKGYFAAKLEGRSIIKLTNHGVPDEVSENLMNDIAEFFRQPLEAKKAYSQLPNNIEGYGQAFVVSDNQKLDWCDRFFLHVRPVESRDLRFWPTNPASFRHSVDVYSSEVAKLSCRLLEFMAKGMGAELASLLGIFEVAAHLRGGSSSASQEDGRRTSLSSPAETAAGPRHKQVAGSRLLGQELAPCRLGDSHLHSSTFGRSQAGAELEQS
ncbi:protein SRG1-like [Panicum miliaceum]|uniref:Protein SRG1-like n=1 Tax=Panicum miliaceum TaxID=4540 RepID=A0A3L6TS67_PANMI|nr:protein SRG1-like [Panicum miliaceum]